MSIAVRAHSSGVRCSISPVVRAELEAEEVLASRKFQTVTTMPLKPSRCRRVSRTTGLPEEWN